MTRDQLIEVLESMDPNEVLALLDGSNKLEDLIAAQVAEETKTLKAEAEASFEKGAESAVLAISETLMEMLAEGRIEDAGRFLEEQGSNRPWYVFKQGALMQGRLSL